MRYVGYVLVGLALIIVVALMSATQADVSADAEGKWEEDCHDFTSMWWPCTPTPEPATATPRPATATPTSGCDNPWGVRRPAPAGHGDKDAQAAPYVYAAPHVHADTAHCDARTHRPVGNGFCPAHSRGRHQNGSSQTDANKDSHAYAHANIHTDADADYGNLRSNRSALPPGIHAAMVRGAYAYAD